MLCNIPDCSNTSTIVFKDWVFFHFCLPPFGECKIIMRIAFSFGWSWASSAKKPFFSFCFTKHHNFYLTKVHISMFSYTYVKAMSITWPSLFRPIGSCYSNTTTTIRWGRRRETGGGHISNHSCDLRGSKTNISFLEISIVSQCTFGGQNFGSPDFLGEGPSRRGNVRECEVFLTCCHGYVILICVQDGGTHTGVTSLGESTNY